METIDFRVVDADLVDLPQVVTGATLAQYGDTQLTAFQGPSLDWYASPPCL